MSTPTNELEALLLLSVPVLWLFGVAIFILYKLRGR
jgi:hypothetical protein